MLLVRPTQHDIRINVLHTLSSHIVAEVDSDRLGYSSVFHVDCEMLVEPDVLSKR